eukprot:Gregarina_sp_Pseudo_9__5217@NODE_57_length_4725_cov_44_259070_g53_i1_p2_GENE_NODE_57_length_4725_cov_44_259070_g53_i1NODE_57_length_4725_cov_44_259070_g53_i1_p2_ORF_typecomplete_len415_score19_42CRTlike/PF08627_10/1_5e27CRTlike/PF08627_10/2_2e03Nuc_sug_transp/PF04142_15/3_4e02Nuc_sug_transp/PF04142_15/5_4e07SLC35F/PF06027_12/9e07UAA/PF08449_11/1_1e06TPT/PF03151_16/4e05EamA/PF00892_20/1_6e02EamA/PF00892_20/0_0016EamA/PF00892_20/1_6DUF3188/PF11384_8/1_2e02DUF3188/PF11384_8/0_83SID1_RNA_chan/PF1396
MSATYLVLSIALVVATGALNNVAGKIKSKPLGRYNVLAALLNACVYTVTYAFVLLISRRDLKLLTQSERQFLKTVPGQRSPLPDDETLSSSTESESIEHLLPANKRSEPPAGQLRSWWYQLRMIKWFVFIGVMEAVGSIMGLMAQAMITGPLYSISLQSIIVFSAILGHYALNFQYSRTQVAAMGIVILGACVSLLSQYESGPKEYKLPQFNFDLGIDVIERKDPAATPLPFFQTVTYAIVAAFSTLPTACSYATKEYLFGQYAKMFPGRTLSIFSVGFLSSLLATCFLPAALIVEFYITESDDSPGEELTRGAYCLSGRTPVGEATDCTWAPAAYLVYIIINVCFNFSLLHLVKISSSLVTFLAMKTVLPVAILIFATIRLPLLERQDQEVSPLVLVGLFLVISGLALYQTGH